MSQIYCVMTGHGFKHEMQVISQIFFAHSRFLVSEKIPAEGYAVLGRLEGTACTGELYLNGKRLTAHTVDIAVELNMKRCLMLALFYALKEATGQPTPWGALCGVRPAKQVRLWLEEGDSEAEIAERLSKVYLCRNDKIKLATKVANAEMKLISEQKKLGVGLYIGIPFCPSRCLYCSFVTAQKNGSDAHKRYLAALAKECGAIAANVRENELLINAIYIGGGTPTALSEDDLAFLMKIVAPFAGGAEYTVEAGRPDSITLEKLLLLKSAGVNRIAINPQTLNNNTLRRIGREHTAEDFFNAYEMARQAGFDNINTDVIAGLPGEGPEDMQQTMEGLKKLMPAQITVHTLAVKRASRLNEYRIEHQAPERCRAALDPVLKEPKLPDCGDFEAVDEMLGIAQEICGDIGLAPYYMYRQKNMIGHFENVGYCVPGYESLYNVAMMAETQTVLAAGAGGVTKYIQGTKIWREFNPKDVETYIGRMENL